MKPKKVLAGLLAAFALVSIGYALGKETTLQRLQAAGPADAPGAGGAADRVVLYYMHPTFRCVTCNAMQKSILEVVNGEFADALAASRLEWKEVNFDEDTTLAGRYNVATSSLVVVRFQGGQEADHKTLDEIWTAKDDPDALKALVRQAVRSRLEGAAP
jgi:hypothetical protein